MAEGIELQFHGAAQTVTGSCYELEVRGKRLLVDCGLFQGSRSLEELNRAPFDFAAAKVDAVILTHAHIDHSGLLPRLVSEGFCGQIWCTEPTRDLIAYLLADSARLQQGDAAHRNHRRDRAGDSPIEPLYTVEDAEQTVAMCQVVPLDSWFEPVAGVRARLWNAGHILGAASVELVAEGVSLLFSGDLGPRHKSLEAAATAPVGIDHVLCESTYGDRSREELDETARRALLKTEVETAMARGGNLIIPVFAVERTQELLLDLATLFDTGALVPRTVFIDSPLATRATTVFARQDLRDTHGGDVFRNTAFHFTESTAESIRLNSLSGAIILAGSGMCEGGRVRHHLVHNLAREESTVLFVGFQAQGSLGRAIVDGAARVRISGRDVAVRAQIRRIEAYSAHADRDDLIAWITGRGPISGSLFLTHGEPQAITALGEAVRAGHDVVTPALGERYQLVAGRPAKRLTTGDAGRQQSIGRDWQNDYADFAVNLKRRLNAIDDERHRREVLHEMRTLLDSYAEHSARRHAAAERGGSHRRHG